MFRNNMLDPFAPVEPGTGENSTSSVGTHQSMPPAISREHVQRELEALCHLEREISADSVAAEYEAISTRTNEKVELGIISRRVVALGDAAGSTSERRIRRALGMSAGLDHPNISPVLGFGATASFIWFSRRIVSGQTFGSLIESSGGIPVKRTLRIAHQVAAALDHAHRRGVTHGTLSAANIIVMENDWVAVRDFAVGHEIARLRSVESEVPSHPAAAPHEFMREPGPMDDQFAMASVISTALSDSGHNAVPHHIDSALTRAMSADPSERFATTLQLAAALSGPELAGTYAIETRASADVPDNQHLLFVDTQPSAGAFRRILMGLLLVAAGAGGAALVMNDRPANLTFVSSGDVAETQTLSPGGTAAIPSGDPGVAAIPNRLDSGKAAVNDSGIPPKLEPYKSDLKVATSETKGATPPQEQKAAPTQRSSSTGSGSTAGRSGRSGSRANVAQNNSSPPPVTSAPGRLFVSSRPWGSLYLDGRFIGETPINGYSVPPGSHRVRIVRSGYHPLDMEINVLSGSDMKLIDLILQENR